jgi:hypothetical protein
MTRRCVHHQIIFSFLYFSFVYDEIFNNILDFLIHNIVESTTSHWITLMMNAINELNYECNLFCSCIVLAAFL